MASMNDPRDALVERRGQEARLREAGFLVDGGGVGFGGWDIFIYNKPEVGEDSSVMLSGVDEVDGFIESYGVCDHCHAYHVNASTSDHCAECGNCWTHCECVQQRTLETVYAEVEAGLYT